MDMSDRPGYRISDRRARSSGFYVVDDDAWYRSVVISSRQVLEAAHAAMAAAETFGLDAPVGQRLPG
jgi:hypothetical protein